ncbi:hypothetical protein HMI54_006362 [Coelomomyces lativittatus]|nr:hypothetical protein HMI56_006978 [Coelomomyces lativittatus]KAJ1517265.1 hypothetical protein HMI54_006362 [Coelomomyces lativittatus]KAJ1517997.1 hypothetical protein HMI55_004155 [Coelomomyces lativittatus]
MFTLIPNYHCLQNDPYSSINVYLRKYNLTKHTGLRSTSSLKLSVHKHSALDFQKSEKTHFNTFVHSDPPNSNSLHESTEVHNHDRNRVQDPNWVSNEEIMKPINQYLKKHVLNSRVTEVTPSVNYDHQTQRGKDENLEYLYSSFESYESLQTRFQGSEEVENLGRKKIYEDFFDKIDSSNGGNEGLKETELSEVELGSANEFDQEEEELRRGGNVGQDEVEFYYSPEQLGQLLNQEIQRLELVYELESILQF